MKRIGNIYDQISDLDNCILAVRNATRYKRKLSRIHSYVFEVATNAEYYGYKVHLLLKKKEFIPSPPDHFEIFEGIGKKHRDIHAPKLFPDQIVHWAIIQVIAPFLLEKFYYYSCGSLPRRGPNLVKKYLSRELAVDDKRHVKVRSKYKYCLKLDIHHYFQSIDRNIMMKVIHEHIKDPHVINVLRDIIFTDDIPEGLPIGYYTSQWLSNLYLHKFDHWLKERLSQDFKDNIYIRYVDDITIVASNKRKLKRIREEISNYLWDNLHLTLKHDSNDQIFDIGKRPIDFVGFKFTYGKTTVRNRIYRNVIDSERKLNKTKYTLHGLCSVISYGGWMNSSCCYNEKSRLYSFPDKFYKHKFKQAQQTYEQKKRIRKIDKVLKFKNAIIRKNGDNRMNGYVTLIKVNENLVNGDNPYTVIEADRIKIR